METHHPDRSEKCEEEDRLVGQLKLACDKDNKEVDLKKSSQALHGMAKLYAANTEQEKLSYIRSAALFNAAIIRDKGNTEIKINLDNLCSTVLNAAKEKIGDENLVQFSMEVKRKLENYRKELKSVELPLIPDNVKGEELVALQKQKIDSVSKMQDDVTAKYTELMKHVSDKCEMIMGKPPCKYTVVGMGSLARAQITLYSDFEHVIVLDDKVENLNKQEREKVMRYFRWFTTIFHIIVINLGETIIPAVAIPTLNGEKGDWFFDSITPRGISFDGMMPHASKMPLGRQQHTETKPWKTELIKPVVEMLKYLDSEVDMKQGYHLADILSKTCYVAGDQSLYKDFKQRANLIVIANDRTGEFAKVKKQVEEDLLNFSINDEIMESKFNVRKNNIKRLIYRNATLFIAALGRFHYIQKSSCFDILDELKEIGVLNEQTKHQLKFMVAVALEIRFKMYMKYGKQEDSISDSSVKDFEGVFLNLKDLVGKTSLIKFTNTVVLLTAVLKNQNLSLFDSKVENLETKILTLGLLELKEEFVTECQIFIEDTTEFHFEIAMVLFTLSPKFASAELVWKVERKALKHCKSEDETFVIMAHAFFTLLSIGDTNYKVEILENQLHDYTGSSSLICRKNSKTQFITCWMAMYYYAYGLQKSGNRKLALVVLQRSLKLCHLNANYTSNEIFGDLQLIRAVSLLCLKDFKEALQALHKIPQYQNRLFKFYQPQNLFLLAICHFGLKNFLGSFLWNFHGVQEHTAPGMKLSHDMFVNTKITFHFLKRFMLEEENEMFDVEWCGCCEGMCDNALNLTLR
ncbi:uncharacterized protein LOC144747085 [Ciona intestinalis]